MLNYSGFFCTFNFFKYFVSVSRPATCCIDGFMRRTPQYFLLVRSLPILTLFPQGCKRNTAQICEHPLFFQLKHFFGEKLRQDDHPLCHALNASHESFTAGHIFHLPEYRLDRLTVKLIRFQAFPGCKLSFHQPRRSQPSQDRLLRTDAGKEAGR